MTSAAKISESYEGRQEVVDGVNDNYKKILAKITIPYETLTVGKVHGQGIKPL